MRPLVPSCGLALALVTCAELLFALQRVPAQRPGAVLSLAAAPDRPYQPPLLVRVEALEAPAAGPAPRAPASLGSGARALGPANGAMVRITDFARPGIVLAEREVDSRGQAALDLVPGHYGILVQWEYNPSISEDQLGFERRIVNVSGEVTIPARGGTAISLALEVPAG